MTLKEIIKKSEEEFDKKFPYHDGACEYLQTPTKECGCWHPDLKSFNRTLARNIVQAILEGLNEYLQHSEHCIRSYFEAGEAAKNGYRQKFQGKWYEARPIDKTPKCDCGLAKELSQLQEMLEEKNI